MTDTRTQHDLLTLLTQRSQGVASFSEMTDLARRIGSEEGFAPEVVESLVQFLESQNRALQPDESQSQPEPVDAPVSIPEPTANPNPTAVAQANTSWTAPKLRVEWGESIAIGRQACPQFFITSPSVFRGEPRVELSIDSRLDHDASACDPELLREDDDRWTFDVPFAMTTGGADCRPGRYRIEVRAAFPHAGGDCPWYYCCTIRLTVGDSSGSDGPTLEIEGDGQSIVNLHGGNLRRFSTIRLKGGDRSIVNLQDPSGASRSGMSEVELPELDDAIFEYELRVDDRRRRLRPIVSVTRPASYESSGRLSLVAPDGRRIQLMTRRKITLGRTSANDIRTYFLPRDSKNDKLTLGISGVHAAIQLAQDGVVINDEGSRNGVSLAGQKIDVERILTEADADEDLRLQLASELRRNAMHLELRLFGRAASSSTAELDAVYCDALRLSRRPKLWQLAASSRIDALRLRRINNLPEEEYVVVYCQAVIGSAADAAIRLPAASIEHRHARVLAIGDVFWIENLGPADSVRVGDRDLQKREVVPLEEGLPVVVGNETISVEPFAQLHF